MKLVSVIGCLVTLAWLLGCSANMDREGVGSGKAGGSGGRAAPGAGGSLMTPAGGSLALGDVTNTGGTPEVAHGECAQQSFVLASKPADVLLVLDRSKSMIEHTVPPNDATRWDAVVPALLDVITATNGSVSWGLKLFPEGEGSECTASSVTAAIPAEIAAGNATKVNGIIATTQALGNGTPTGDAILSATAYLQSRGATNQFIVLATDGDPSCPSGDAAEAHATSAIAAALAAGFPTYVIGVLDPVADKGKFPILNQMADAGGTARSDNPVADKFYQAYSQQELTSALEAVTGQVASCVFELEGRPPAPDNIAVKINGERVEQDPAKSEGWAYTSDAYLGLELYGSACQRVKDATENKVDIIFGCRGMPLK
ncbi:MAG TPA: vWA domain-containing protein [Polyangiaceae bacterium]